MRLTDFSGEVLQYYAEKDDFLKLMEEYTPEEQYSMLLKMADGGNRQKWAQCRTALLNADENRENFSESIIKKYAYNRNGYDNPASCITWRVDSQIYDIFDHAYKFVYAWERQHGIDYFFSKKFDEEAASYLKEHLSEGCDIQKTVNECKERLKQKYGY